jgi:hypothetical protein
MSSEIFYVTDSNRVFRMSGAPDHIMSKVRLLIQCVENLRVKLHEERAAHSPRVTLLAKRHMLVLREIIQNLDIVVKEHPTLKLAVSRK